MTTIIRVKRHRGEDPVEALVLSCKRKKTEDSSAEHDLVEKVLNFSGTVERKDNEIATSTVQSFNKDSKYKNFKKTHTPEIKSKQREEQKERREDNRFTLLSCLRSISTDKNIEADDSKENFAIVDVSKETDEKFKKHETPEDAYVYDLYCLQEDGSDFNDIYMENLLSVQPLETELEYRNGEDCFEEIDPDEDDSNDENNWRNDYPDSDSSMEDDEDADILVKQMKGVRIGDEELSDDSGEPAYLNYYDDDDYDYYEAESWEDKYDKYKEKVIKRMKDSEDGSSDSDDYEYHEALPDH